MYDCPMDQTAGDRYRLEVTSGSIVKGLLGRPPKSDGGETPRKRGRMRARVSIVGPDHKIVWTRDVTNHIERDHLVRIISEQVFPARLEDFEHWLRTEGRENGGLA